MLLPSYSDNRNLDFTFNCLDWLSKRPDGTPRDRVLFIDDGRIDTDFNLLLRELPPPTPEEILEALWNNRDKASAVVSNLERNGWFRDLERENLFNRILHDAFPHWVIVRFVLIAGAVVLFIYAIRRLVIARSTGARNFPRLAQVLDRYRPRAGLLETRLQGALRAGQFYEVARINARELFASLGIRPALEGEPPTIEIEAGWWRRTRIESDLREIWQIAFGLEPVPVPARKWERWNQRLDEMGNLIRTRVVRFE
jgi:hypothetical protein